MLIRPLRSTALAAALMALTLAAVPACTSTPVSPGANPATPAAEAAPRITAMTDISAGCPGNSSEVEEAFAPPGYLYAEWIGCGGIGFARSADSGRHFGAAIIVPGSRGFSWDPAITVAADGTVYAAFMHSAGQRGGVSNYPVIAVSRDHGATFTQVHEDLPPKPGNWGDRDFIAAGRGGQLFLTWDYGPSAGAVKTQCARGGSCAYSAGDLNIVVQASGDGGATWGPIVHLEPGFPLGGGYSAPLVVAPGGRVDVLYDAHPTDRGSEAVHPGHEYFTSSADGTHWPAAPAPLWPGQGTLSLPAWWIDGDISADAAGNLYATWDTQSPAGDIGWLTWSRDGGRTWSAPVRVTPDRDQAPHIVESAGGRPGVAYIAWQTSGTGPGYATYLRLFSIRHGWLGPAVKVSAAYGNVGIWPGDTFGIAPLPGGSISLTWGSAVGSRKVSGIYASVVTISALPGRGARACLARVRDCTGAARAGSKATRRHSGSTPPGARPASGWDQPSGTDPASTSGPGCRSARWGCARAAARLPAGSAPSGSAPDRWAGPSRASGRVRGPAGWPAAAGQARRGALPPPRWTGASECDAGPAPPR